jgi:hypothetical protein
MTCLGGYGELIEVDWNQRGWGEAKWGSKNEDGGERATW